MVHDGGLTTATDEVGSTPVANGNGDAGEDVTRKEQPREFLRIGRRTLNEEELASPAARRFMIAEIERLDRECAELKTIQNSYGELRERLAALTAANKKSRWLEILSSMCLLAGAAGLGAAPSYLAIDGVHGIGWTFVVASALLTIVGVLARVAK